MEQYFKVPFIEKSHFPILMPLSQKHNLRPSAKNIISNKFTENYQS